MKGLTSSFAGDGGLVSLALGHIESAIVAADPRRVNGPGAVFYVGVDYVAVVVPNGIKAVLERIRSDSDYRYLSHTAILHALGRRGACLALRKGRTILRARILYHGRRGAQRVNVILIPRNELWLENPPPFQGAIQFFDPDLDCELSIPGFAPRLDGREPA